MRERYVKITGNDIKMNLVNLPQIVLEVTDICNLRCRYCGYGELYDGFDPRANGNLSFRKACTILDYLANIWEENIATSLCKPFILGFYGGEPLISFNLIMEIIQYVESLNIKSKKFYYNMTTNGLLLDKYIDSLADKEFELLISLDGNEKDHSYRVDQQGVNSHKKIIENIKLLQKKYPDYFEKHVNFNTVLHNRNSVESAHNYIKFNFGKETKISSLNSSGIRKDKIKEFFNLYQNMENSIVNAINKEELESELLLEAPRTVELLHFLYKFSGNMFDNYNALFYDESKVKITPTGTCTPFYKKMFITVSGKILQCEKINHEFALGNVTDDYVDIDFEKVAEFSNDYNLRLEAQCSTCEYLGKCIQCVFQIDEINSSKPKCYGFIDKKLFEINRSKILRYLSDNPSLYQQIMKNVQLKN